LFATTIHAEHAEIVGEPSGEKGSIEMDEILPLADDPAVKGIVKTVEVRVEK
jgi:hypothetical protein